MMKDRLDCIPENQIHILGLQALKERLGVVGTLKFLEQFESGAGDYTTEKYKEEDIDMGTEEILAMFAK